MRLLLIVPLFFLSFVADFDEVYGYYYGEKEDYITEIRLYDDQTFDYTARCEFPFEVSEGIWSLKGDTVILNSEPCKDPERLTHVPVRTYKTIVNEKYFYKKSSITPIVNGKLVKSEILLKEK